MNRFYGYEVVHFGRNCAKWAPWRWQALDKMIHQKWRVANRRLEIEYANTLQRSRMVLIFLQMLRFYDSKSNMFLKSLSRWLDVISAKQRVHESPPHPPKQIGRRNATSWRRGRWRKRSLVRSEGKARRSECPGKVFQWKLAKLTFTCTIDYDSIFLTELDELDYYYYIFDIGQRELVSLQVTSHNWLSTCNRWCRTILLNWRCKIPANSSNITAWWILCKSAWFERCTNIGNIYPWNTTQDATSSTLDLVKKAKGWKFHPRRFCRKNGELHHVEKVANILEGPSCLGHRGGKKKLPCFWICSDYWAYWNPLFMNRWMFVFFVA